MMRALHLAQSLVAQQLIAGVGEKDLTDRDLLHAKEVMMIGTTLDVLPVTEFEGQNIGTGKVGEIARTLRRWIQEDARA
jgi:branched-chain amino acid aminotransferase